MQSATQTTSEPVGFATVDFSNLLAGGQHLARDIRWRPHARRLLQFLAGPTGRLKDAVLVGSHARGHAAVFAPPFEAAGFRTVFRARNCVGREKAVDATADVEVLFSVLERGNPAIDDVTLVAGDTDHLALVEGLVKRGFRVDICCWRHVTSAQLIRAATRFIPLDPFISQIGFLNQPHHHAYGHAA